MENYVVFYGVYECLFSQVRLKSSLISLFCSPTVCILCSNVSSVNNLARRMNQNLLFPALLKVSTLIPSSVSNLSLRNVGLRDNDVLQILSAFRSRGNYFRRLELHDNLLTDSVVVPLRMLLRSLEMSPDHFSVLRNPYLSPSSVRKLHEFHRDEQDLEIEERIGLRRDVFLQWWAQWICFLFPCHNISFFFFVVNYACIPFDYSKKKCCSLLFIFFLYSKE